MRHRPCGPAPRPRAARSASPGGITMDEHIDPNRTVDQAPSDSLVAAFRIPPVRLREPDTEPPAPTERFDSPEMPTGLSGRLELHGEIARGGMGAVLKGRDAELGREVAVKVLLEAHAARGGLVQ